MEAILNREQQKEIALGRLKQMNIYKPFINAFARKDIVTMFENFGGFYVTEGNCDEDLIKEIKGVEKEYGCLVYAVTHEFTSFGELYSLLCVSKYAEDERQGLLEQSGSEFFAFAWVYNKTDYWCSEFGEVTIQSALGGLRRVG